MSGPLALVELVLVFALVLGLGIWELRKVKRDTREAADRTSEVKDPKASD